MLNDVCCNADDEHRTVIIQVDLSAVFSTLDLYTLIRRLQYSFGLNVTHVQYADDIELYIAFDGRSSLLAFDSCFRAVHEWFDYNGLSLN